MTFGLRTSSPALRQSCMSHSIDLAHSAAPSGLDLDCHVSVASSSSMTLEMHEPEALERRLAFLTMLNNKPGCLTTTQEFAVFG
jgi:hypothetical protein